MLVLTQSFWHRKILGNAGWPIPLRQSIAGREEAEGCPDSPNSPEPNLNIRILLSSSQASLQLCKGKLPSPVRRSLCTACRRFKVPINARPPHGCVAWTRLWGFWTTASEVSQLIPPLCDTSRAPKSQRTQQGLQRIHGTPFADRHLIIASPLGFPGNRVTQGQFMPYDGTTDFFISLCTRTRLWDLETAGGYLLQRKPAALKHV
ncbi:hypothetical protein DL98DRAFT_130756 [Cadophora sp. DSE1049]|nr:hypothetical protein DL98DRAFT_130756 [Cadophora sp. DSE1049]